MMSWVTVYSTSLTTGKLQSLSGKYVKCNQSYKTTFRLINSHLSLTENGNRQYRWGVFSYSLVCEEQAFSDVQERYVPSLGPVAGSLVTANNLRWLIVLRSFGMIRKRITHPRSLGSRCTVIQVILDQ